MARSSPLPASSPIASMDATAANECPGLWAPGVDPPGVAFPLRPYHGVESQAGIFGVVATDCRLDQPIRAVVSVEHFVVVLDVEPGEIIDEVMLVRRREADFGDPGLTIDHRCPMSYSVCCSARL